MEIESSEEELESAPLFNLNQDKAAEQSIEADSSNPSQNERVNFEAMVSNFERIVNAASVQAQAINESVQGLKDRIDVTAEQAKQNAMEIENFDFKFTLHDMEIQKLKKDIRYCKIHLQSKESFSLFVLLRESGVTKRPTLDAVMKCLNYNAANLQIVGREGLMQLKGIGPKTVQKLEKMCEKYGFQF